MKPTFSWSVIQKKVGFFWMERKDQYIFLENNLPIKSKKNMKSGKKVYKMRRNPIKKNIKQYI